MKSLKYKRSVPLAAALLVAAAILGVVEAGARIAYEFREELRFLPLLSGFLQRSLILDPYEMPSPGGGYHWVLRPGYTVSAAGLTAEKKASGRRIGVEALENGLAGKVAYEPEPLRINSRGFRGAEIDPSHSRVRILTVGDSVTFGTGSFTYPQVVAKALNGAGLGAEVINGGVEGYSWRNIYLELDRYKEVQPEIVTLFVGWNSIFSHVPPTGGFEDHLRVFWLGRKILHAFRLMALEPREYALRMYNRTLSPDRNGGDVRALEGYAPPFLERMEQVVEAFESTGARVVIVTLPGLFAMEEVPNSRALKIGHLPEYTTNPFVLAKMTAVYNDALRAVADQRGLPVIDLERWSLKNFQPRSDFFSDSVHLTPRGLERVGLYFAGQLQGLVEEVRNQ